MKKVKAKNLIKQIICIIIVLMLCNFIIPNYAYAIAKNPEIQPNVNQAGAKNGDSGVIFAPFCKFITFLCDNVMQFMQNTFTSVEDIEQEDGTYDFKYSPGIIFSGTVPAFDINFINPGTSSVATSSIEDYIIKNEANFRMTQSIDSDVYEQKLAQIKSTKYDGALTGREYMYSGDYRDTIKYDIYYKINNNTLTVETIGEFGTKVGSDLVRRYYIYGKQELTIADGVISGVNVDGTPNSAKLSYESIASKLQNTIATWYNALRRIALVGLLSVLVYLGIRIVILSASGKESSKYKKMLIDWLVALCLLFTLHYLMSITLVITQKISGIFSNGETDTVLNTLRNKITEGKTWEVVVSEVIMYVIMTIYTVLFSFQYLKRVLYMGFFTMIAPLVTLTYPLDKIKDSKAQAFTMWIKEYIFNALIQVVHLLVYYTLVGSALSLVDNYPLYGVVAIGFITQAERIIRKMFGFNTATTVGTMEAMATGGLVTAALNKLQKVSKPNQKTGSPEKSSNNNVRTVANSIANNLRGDGTTSGVKLKSGPSIHSGAWAVAKKYGGATLKAATKTATGATGAMLGFAGGVAKGDISAALTGAATGGAIGAGLANNGIKFASNIKDNVKNLGNDIQDTYNEGAYGSKNAENMKMVKAFKQTKEYEELKNEFGDKLSDDKLSELLEIAMKEQEKQ